MKTNIQDIEPTLEKVKKLRPKLYEMQANNHNGEKTIGFIAQEVKALFAELVFINENSKLDKKGIENVHAVSYAGFGVIAIKAIQEQQEQIEANKKEIYELKLSVQRLEKLLLNK